MLSLVPQGDPEGLPLPLCYFKDIWQGRNSPPFPSFLKVLFAGKFAGIEVESYKRKQTSKKKIPTVMNCSHIWNHWNISGHKNKDIFLLLAFHPTSGTSPSLWVHLSYSNSMMGEKWTLKTIVYQDTGSLASLGGSVTKFGEVRLTLDPQLQNSAESTHTSLFYPLLSGVGSIVREGPLMGKITLNSWGWLCCIRSAGELSEKFIFQ